MSKTYIETLVEDISYDSLGDWKLPNLSDFSYGKTLFPYQAEALKNLAKTLMIYFTNPNGKEFLYSSCVSLGMDQDSFNILKYQRPIDKKNGFIDKRYSLFLNYFNSSDEYIDGFHLFNRMAFWMATGSGKSIVLIKAIEYLYYLQKNSLIPEKDIMLLLPRADLISQFKREVNEYNLYKDLPIELVNLKDYEKDKNTLTLLKGIKVYYYRSDLVRDERKENILDYTDYDNGGNWYIFLDEAHRGETGSSNMQDYVSILSRNGFLFNFSATFTDAIDYATTAYNFNLEKFINAGYGKKIYLSNSYFDFRNDNDDFSEGEKQRQVLKSFLTMAMIKKSTKRGFYHSPLLMTLVNSINTDESDLLIFFKKMEGIATGQIDNGLFADAKEGLIRDFENNAYMIGSGELKFDVGLIESLSLRDILETIFNANTNGKIEILEGEEGRELALKLQTSDIPFGLIKIGDAAKFQREKLGTNYTFISGYDNRSYFKNLNNDNRINILLGSRSFYEGWDSNRPNVINFINIGGRDAKKYVLQAIGRGVRIEPRPGERKRLLNNDTNKNPLLETLFVYATDKNGVKSILDTLDEQKYTDEYQVSLFVSEQKPFELLIPKYKNADRRDEIAYYYVSEDNKKKFIDYFNGIDENLLLLKTGMEKETYNFLKNKLENDGILRIDNSKHHDDYNVLLNNLINHLAFKNKVVGRIQELDDEIIHFKHIKVLNLSSEKIKLLEEQVKRVRDFKPANIDVLYNEYKSGKIRENEFKERINAKPQETFDGLKIIKLAQHYYLPLIYSEVEKVKYIKHIIKVASEVTFIKSLSKYIENNTIKHEWMFSKIDESKDRVYIPLYLRKENRYSRFFPDFIFWLKKGNEYKIIFVDPKGSAHVDYINKIKEFERIFFDNGIPKVYKYNNYDITFDLKMITDDINAIPSDYNKYWANLGDFDFLTT